jgi:hypothetical protein
VTVDTVLDTVFNGSDIRLARTPDFGPVFPEKPRVSEIGLVIGATILLATLPS